MDIINDVSIRRRHEHNTAIGLNDHDETLEQIGIASPPWPFISGYMIGLALGFLLGWWWFA